MGIRTEEKKINMFYKKNKNNQKKNNINQKEYKDNQIEKINQNQLKVKSIFEEDININENNNNIINNNNNIINSNIRNSNVRKNYSIDVDNKYTKEKNKNPKNKNVRSKSIVRGGDYQNVLVTHTIYASSDIDFHIIDPLKITTDEARKKYMIKIDEKNRNGLNGKVRVTSTSSCDKIKKMPKEKIKVNSIVKNVELDNEKKRNNKERKEGKEGKDSIIKINIRNAKKDNNTNKVSNGGGLSASYKKRNQKNNNNDGIKIKKISN